MAQSKEKQPSTDDILRRKAHRFHRLFNSPDGKKVLQDLKDELDPDELKGATDADTNYNIGKRDAFVYIKQLIRYEENARQLEG